MFVGKSAVDGRCETKILKRGQGEGVLSGERTAASQASSGAFAGWIETPRVFWAAITVKQSDRRAETKLSDSFTRPAATSIRGR